MFSWPLSYIPVEEGDHLRCFTVIFKILASTCFHCSLYCEGAGVSLHLSLVIINNVTVTSNDASIGLLFLPPKNGPPFAADTFAIRTLIVTCRCAPSSTRGGVPVNELKM